MQCKAMAKCLCVCVCVCVCDLGWVVKLFTGTLREIFHGKAGLDSRVICRVNREKQDKNYV